MVNLIKLVSFLVGHVKEQNTHIKEQDAQIAEYRRGAYAQPLLSEQESEESQGVSDGQGGGADQGLPTSGDADQGHQGLPTNDSTDTVPGRDADQGLPTDDSTVSVRGQGGDGSTVATSTDGSEVPVEAANVERTSTGRRQKPTSPRRHIRHSGCFLWVGMICTVFLTCLVTLHAMVGVGSLMYGASPSDVKILFADCRDISIRGTILDVQATHLLADGEVKMVATTLLYENLIAPKFTFVSDSIHGDDITWYDMPRPLVANDPSPVLFGWKTNLSSSSSSLFQGTLHLQDQDDNDFVCTNLAVELPAPRSTSERTGSIMDAFMRLKEVVSPAVIAVGGVTGLPGFAVATGFFRTLKETGDSSSAKETDWFRMNAVKDLKMLSLASRLLMLVLPEESHQLPGVFHFDTEELFDLVADYILHLDVHEVIHKLHDHLPLHLWHWIPCLWLFPCLRRYQDGKKTIEAFKEFREGLKNPKDLLEDMRRLLHVNEEGEIKGSLCKVYLGRDWDQQNRDDHIFRKVDLVMKIARAAGEAPLDMIRAGNLDHMEYDDIKKLIVRQLKESMRQSLDELEIVNIYDRDWGMVDGQPVEQVLEEAQANVVMRVSRSEETANESTVGREDAV